MKLLSSKLTVLLNMFLNNTWGFAALYSSMNRITHSNCSKSKQNTMGVYLAILRKANENKPRPWIVGTLQVVCWKAESHRCPYLALLRKLMEDEARHWVTIEVSYWREDLTYFWFLKETWWQCLILKYCPLQDGIRSDFLNKIIAARKLTSGYCRTCRWIVRRQSPTHICI